jgi:hypothetical protein
VIETTKRLPRAERYAKQPGERYTAVVVRRCSDGRRVTYHGLRTADKDLDGMPLDPGLLFGVVYRGEGKDGFEDFKHWTTRYDPPERAAAAAPAAPAAEPERPRQPVTREAQQEATEVRNGRRPAPGTAAKIAEREAGVPTEDAIAAVRDRADGRRLLLAASPEFKATVTAASPKLFTDTKAEHWRDALTAARQAMLQETPA